MTITLDQLKYEARCLYATNKWRNDGKFRTIRECLEWVLGEYWAGAYR